VALQMLSCGGGNASSGDHAGQLNGLFRITPSSATVIVHQTLSFSASSSESGGATWSVLPPEGGTIDAQGLFTASSSPGQYQIVAMWNKDVRYTATASVLVVPSPPIPLPPGMVQAFGSLQGNGPIRNAAIAGAPVPTQASSNSTGTLQIHHGFYIPTTP